jgi:hypothetical protein
MRSIVETFVPLDQGCEAEIILSVITMYVKTRWDPLKHGCEKACWQSRSKQAKSALEVGPPRRHHNDIKRDMDTDRAVPQDNCLRLAPDLEFALQGVARLFRDFLNGASQIPGLGLLLQTSLVDE